MKILWVLVGLVGCGSSGGSKTVDAQGVADVAVHVDARVDAPADAPHAFGMAMSHTLFVETEGVTLSAGSPDATMNKVGFVTADTTLLAWRANDANRATQIADTVAQIQATLAPYNITVVTTRPAAAPYTMVVITDTQPTAIGFSSGTFGVADNPATCNSVTNEIGLLFPAQFGAYSDTVRSFVATSSIAIFGFANGVPQAKTGSDCMCFSSPMCTIGPQACTIGGPGTAIFTDGSCGDHDATMNEAAVFLAVFGPHQ